MKTAHCVQIVLHQIHLLDKLWNQLYEGVKFVANFPATLTDDFAKEIPSICYVDHWVRKMSVTENLRVSERVLVRHLELKLVTLYLRPDQL